MIEFSCRESLGDVPAEEWDALVGDRSFYLCHSWLSAQDAGQPVDAGYLLARSRGRLVGALPVYRVRKETNGFYLPENCADGRWRGRYLLAGARRAYTNSLIVADDLTAGDRAEVTRGLLARLRQRAGDAGARGALFLYLTTSAARSLCAAFPAGHPVLTSMEAVLDLPGPDFGGYLRTLSGHRRRVIRHEMEVFGRAGLAVRAEPAAEVWEQMAPLVANLQRRHGHQAPDEHWRQLVRRQAADLADQAVVFTCRRGGTLVGACLAYPWRGALYVKLCGFDYARLCGGFEYFNLVYYAPIRYACDNGLSRIHYGREAFAAKLNRGARLAPLWSMELPALGCPPPDAAEEWNRATAARWRAELSHSSRYFSDPGWSLWGCDLGAGVD